MRQIKKILIAEDELLVAKVLIMTLEKRSFKVTHVIDEASAIKMASEFQPDLIILDIHLKNKTNGIKAGKEIRKNGLKCPIIFTTGNSFEQTKLEISDIDNCYLFIKPIDSEQLLKHIDLYLVNS
jgi:DNA-binding response OmpR family regulator